MRFVGPHRVVLRVVVLRYPAVSAEKNKTPAASTRGRSRETIVENCNCNRENRSTDEVEWCTPARAGPTWPCSGSGSGPILIPDRATVLFTFVPGDSGYHLCASRALAVPSGLLMCRGPSGQPAEFDPRTALGIGRHARPRGPDGV